MKAGPWRPSPADDVLDWIIILGCAGLAIVVYVIQRVWR